MTKTTNEKSVEELWCERAASSSKTLDWVDAHINQFPPEYKPLYNWNSLLKKLPPVENKDLTPRANEDLAFGTIIAAFVDKLQTNEYQLKRNNLALYRKFMSLAAKLQTKDKSTKLFDELALSWDAFNDQIAKAEDASQDRKTLYEESEDKLRILSTKFYKVLHNGQSMLYNVGEDTWTTYEDCNRHYGHEKIDIPETDKDGNVKIVTKKVFAAYVDYDSPSRFDRVLFNPRKPGHYEHTFNLFQGWRIAPEEGNDDELVWDLLRRICDYNEGYFEYVKKWFAHMVQRPWERPGTCLGVSGPQRLGKNTLIETFGMLLSTPAMVEAMNQRNTAHKDSADEALGTVIGTGAFGIFTSYDNVFGDYNYQTGSKLLLLMDEATWSGSNMLKAKFKTAITGATVTIADKFVKKIDIQNYRRYVLLSNDSDYLAVDPDDGRLLPLEYKAENKPSKDWFNRFYELRANGKMLSNLMYRLEHVDLADWNPMTALNELTITTGASLQTSSKSEFELWLEDVVVNGAMEIEVQLDGGRGKETVRTEICGSFIEDDDLRRSYCLTSGARGLRGWKKYSDLRNKVFGPRVRSTEGLRPYGRQVPSHSDLCKNLEATSRWKYQQFDAVETPTQQRAKLKVV